MLTNTIKYWKGIIFRKISKLMILRSLILLSAILTLAFGCQTTTEQPAPWNDPLESLRDENMAPFYHGVASGDPTQQAVIIWTKVTPKDSLATLDINWQLSDNKSFENITKSGTYTTDPSRNYIVKIDVEGLEAGTTYYYKFDWKGQESIVGRTKTAPSNADSLKLALVSCSNYEAGFFNSYKAIADNEELDAVLHLGDYIYEYGVGVYGDSASGRFHEPNHEIIQLSDYRTRYSQYRLDPDLRAAHQMHPFITIWDDHEIANNSYKDGAENHQPEEGDYNDRKANARKAYYEWLPVRSTDPLYRSIDYGNLAKIIMLDERLEGRTQPADSVEQPDLNDPERTMLGKAQLDWFTEELANSDQQWKIIGNQVIFSYLNWGYPGFYTNLDSWDGYPAEQSAIIDYISSNDIENVVFVTGDTHSSWALEVTNDPFGTYASEGAVAVEYGTTSINSANSNERFDTELVKEHEMKISGDAINPHLKYANMRDHGYVELSLFPDFARARYYYVDTVIVKSDQYRLAKELFTPSGSNWIVEDIF